MKLDKVLIIKFIKNGDFNMVRAYDWYRTNSTFRGLGLKVRKNVKTLITDSLKNPNIFDKEFNIDLQDDRPKTIKMLRVKMLLELIKLETLNQLYEIKNKNLKSGIYVSHQMLSDILKCSTSSVPKYKKMLEDSGLVKWSTSGYVESGQVRNGTNVMLIINRKKKSAKTVTKTVDKPVEIEEPKLPKYPDIRHGRTVIDNYIVEYRCLDDAITYDRKPTYNNKDGVTESNVTLNQDNPSPFEALLLNSIDKHIEVINKQNKIKSKQSK